MKVETSRRTIGAIAVAVTALLFAAGVGALEPGQPSKTSIMVAACRGYVSHDPDPSIRNPDWLAEQLIGPKERALIPEAASIKALSLPYEDALKNGSIGVCRMMLIRTRFIDDRLKEAVDGGAKQIVILGAGFDSRAYRLRSELANTRVFEVDYGPTQEYKKQRVLEVLGGFPPNLKFVPIDFTKEKLDVVLHKAGFRDNLRTFVIWEGVTYYVPEDGVRSTLQVLSKMAPGSQIAVDFMNHTFVFGDPSAPPRATAPGFPQWGEPWVFGIADNTEDKFFGQYGFTIDKRASVTGSDPDVAKMYLTRHDGSIFGGPITNRTGWWVAELSLAKH